MGGGGVPGVVEYPGGLRGKGESNQCGFCDRTKDVLLRTSKIDKNVHISSKTLKRTKR